MTRILLLDNYDSFTYNLYHYLREFTPHVEVLRNDEIEVEQTDQFSHFVLSPGPGLPGDAGILMPLIKRHFATKPMLGVCLGMQALALNFGGDLYNQNVVRHGVTTEVTTKRPSTLFNKLPNKFNVGLYHSWAVSHETMPTCFATTATNKENVVMAIEHQSLPIYGVQFHPESVLTEFGHEMIKNWLSATQAI